jgi:hypothetical protein
MRFALIILQYTALQLNTKFSFPSTLTGYTLVSIYNNIIHDKRKKANNKIRQMCDTKTCCRGNPVARKLISDATTLAFQQIRSFGQKASLSPACKHVKNRSYMKFAIAKWLPH